MMDTPTTMRLFGTAVDSIVDGPGLRYAVFTQGCPHHCPGCHNEKSQPFEGGYDQSIDTLFQEITSNKLISGVTLSGGEPLEQSGACKVLAQKLKDEGYNLWVYTGFLFEDILAGTCGSDAIELLNLCDVLVDGPFVKEMHDYELKWRGSTNQRVIDLQKSLQSNSAVLWKESEIIAEVPPSW